MNALTKQNITAAGIITLAFLVGVVAAQEVAPDFTLTDIDGNDFSLSDHRGRAVLLDFFAIWCSACVAEIPHLKSLHSEFGEDLTIISISVSPASDTVEKLQQFRQTHEMEWIVARDTIGVSDRYGDIYPIPTLVLIDQEGNIQHRHSGLTDESVLREELHEIMHERVNILSPENKTYFTQDVPLTFSVSESPSWIGYSLDGQANITIADNATLSELSDGTHSVVIYVRDVLGSVRASEIVHFSIETSQPDSGRRLPSEPFIPWIVVPTVIAAVAGVAALIYLRRAR